MSRYSIWKVKKKMMNGSTEEIDEEKKLAEIAKTRKRVKVPKLVPVRKHHTKGDSQKTPEINVSASWKEIDQTDVPGQSSYQVNFFHCGNMMTSMYEMQQNGIFCDFSISLLPSAYNQLRSPVSYGVHKLVFASLSFDKEFLKKSSTEIGGKINCKGLLRAIEFVYLGNVTNIETLSIREVVDIRQAAMALNINFDNYLTSHRPGILPSEAPVSVADSVASQQDAESKQTTAVCPSTLSDDNIRSLLSNDDILKDFKPLFGIQDDSPIDRTPQPRMNEFQNGIDNFTNMQVIRNNMDNDDEQYTSGHDEVVVIKEELSTSGVFENFCKNSVKD